MKLIIRKTDYFLQCLLVFIMLGSVPVLLLYGFLAGLFVMGCWQLLSAAFNTSSFFAVGLGRQIGTYWKWTGIVMAFFFLCFPLSLVFNPDDVQVLGCVAVSASVPIAYYYLTIYKKLIRQLELRDELSGLLKSKH